MDRVIWLTALGQLVLPRHPLLLLLGRSHRGGDVRSTEDPSCRHATTSYPGLLRRAGREEGGVADDGACGGVLWTSASLVRPASGTERDRHAAVHPGKTGVEHGLGGQERRYQESATVPGQPNLKLVQQVHYV